MDISCIGVIRFLVVNVYKAAGDIAVGKDLIYFQEIPCGVENSIGVMLSVVKATALNTY